MPIMTFSQITNFGHHPLVLETGKDQRKYKTYGQLVSPVVIANQFNLTGISKLKKKTYLQKLSGIEYGIWWQLSSCAEGHIEALIVVDAEKQETQAGPSQSEDQESPAWFWG